MSIDRMERHFMRLMMMAILCHVYRDWGPLGQIGIFTACWLGAFLHEKAHTSGEARSPTAGDGE